MSSARASPRRRSCALAAPIPEVILDPATDDRAKTKLTFVMEARNYAIDVFELDVGRSYTSFSQLESDTLALVPFRGSAGPTHPEDVVVSDRWESPVQGVLQ